MNQRKDITTVEDIKILVDQFYSQVRLDDLLGAIFQNVIGNNWPMHLEKMVRFWQTVLLDEHTYYGSPFPPHAQLPISSNHFNRWKDIFKETVDTLFKGEKANEAKWRAEKMAEMFELKITHYQGSTSKPLI